MRIILDDHELSAVDGGAADAIEAARQACEAQGRVITDVFLDDRHLDREGLEAATTQNPQGEVLRCQSADPFNLVEETFEYVEDALSEVDKLHQSISQRFQSGEMGEGLEELKQALALWNSVREGVEQGCLLVHLDVEQVRTESQQVDQALTSLAERLDAIRRAVSNQDWSSLADTLGYEMEPVVSDWRTFVQVLGDRVEAMRASGGGQ